MSVAKVGVGRREEGGGSRGWKTKIKGDEVVRAFSSISFADFPSVFLFSP